jgi:HD superfamily phosphohydrolase
MLSVSWNKFVIGVSGVFLVVGLLALFRYKQVCSKPQNITLKGEQSMFIIQDDKITTPYGSFTVEEKVIFDLIQSAAFQRIRYIHQYGVMKWIRKSPEYSRFSHCLGVWALLRRYNAPLNEQIAGLLHDVSHTVFSHLGDHIFNHHSIYNSYQDDIHEWFLRKYSIDKILANYSIELRDILHKAAGYTMLEQNLPNLCADRIEYNLRGGVVAGLLKNEEIEPILEQLRFQDGRWFFLDVVAAAKFSRISLYLTENEWGSPANDLVYSWMAKAVQRALELQVVTFDEVHFSTDDVIWERLNNATDKIIKDYLHKAINYEDQFSVISSPASANRIIRTKFRGVNPWVLVDGEFNRLIDLDLAFAQEYERVQSLTQNGWAIKFASGVKAGL